MRIRLPLLVLALAGVLALALLEVFHGTIEHLGLGFLDLFVHHLAALIAGASTAGILFELFAREEFMKELTKKFLSDEELVGLFADEKRTAWVHKLLNAQISRDAAHESQGLSTTIFNDVVAPFMERRKFRSRMSYSIGFKPSPPSGWAHRGIQLLGRDYIGLEVELDMVQHLAPPIGRDVRQRSNVSIVYGANVEDLQGAFDDEACVYREHLMLLPDAQDRTRWEAFAREVSRDPSILEALGLGVSIEVSKQAMPLSSIEQAPGRLVIWFEHEPTERLDLFIRLHAPYPRAMKYFEVVFGEPVKSPRVTFKPSPVASPHDVTVIDYLQGPRRAAPRKVLTNDGVDVTFPVPKEEPAPKKGLMSHARRKNAEAHMGQDGDRWILPRSGLVFLWHKQLVPLETETVEVFVIDGS